MAARHPRDDILQHRFINYYNEAEKLIFFQCRSFGRREGRKEEWGRKESLQTGIMWRAVDSSRQLVLGAALLFLGVFLLAFFLPRRQRAEAEIQIKEGKALPGWDFIA